VIEGLRGLPWLQERIRNDRAVVEYLIDCEKCRMSTDVTIRQAMGCGWEPRSELVQIRPWQHQGYTEQSPTTCIGYTSKLPEVVEINRARMHWKQGELREFCGGKPNPNLMRGIEILEGAAAEASSWREDEKK
jgi:hypothetical protein